MQQIQTVIHWLQVRARAHIHTQGNYFFYKICRSGLRLLAATSIPTTGKTNSKIKHWASYPEVLYSINYPVFQANVGIVSIFTLRYVINASFQSLITQLINKRINQTQLHGHLWVMGSVLNWWKVGSQRGNMLSALSELRENIATCYITLNFLLKTISISHVPVC
jgi:hypothetical protein